MRCINKAHGNKARTSCRNACMVLLLDYADPGILRGNSFDPEIFTASSCEIDPRRNPVFLCRTAIGSVSESVYDFFSRCVASSSDNRHSGAFRHEESRIIKNGSFSQALVRVTDRSTKMRVNLYKSRQIQWEFVGKEDMYRTGSLEARREQAVRGLRKIGRFIF